MLQIKLVRLQLRPQLKILPLGNAAQQARLEPPQATRVSSLQPRASQSVTNCLKIRQKTALIAPFNIFMPRTEKAERKQRLLI